MKFEQAYEQFIHAQINTETNGRRRERLENGIGHGEKEFLRTIWYPVVGHFENLYPEWEVRDFMNNYRYLDLAYMPGNAKGVIEIQGYGSHARDIEVWRFKDLCMRHCHLALDGWLVMPIAYPAIIETPKLCQQLILSFIGRFISFGSVPDKLSWMECETLRYARRLLRPFTPSELSDHLRVSTRYARILLHNLVEKELVVVMSGNERNRTYKIHF
ncbi:MAG: transcriptional regulator [Paenibacillus sp.]|nr:transcriptional regulator [Paenibacillus sp.]